MSQREEENRVAAQAPGTIRAEFMDWIVDLIVESGMIRAHLGAVVRFRGRLDERLLTRAVRMLIDVEPVLGCRFVADHDPPYWERLADLDRLVTVPVRETADAEGDAAAFVAAGIPVNAGPRFVATLLRGSVDDTLVAKVDHVAVDGGGTKQALYVLGRLYRTLQITPGYAPPPDPRPRSLASIAKTASLSERLKAVRFRRHFPRTDWSVPGLGGDGDPTYITDTVEASQFRRLIELGKRRGATVHDLLLAAYFRTLYLELEPAPGARTPINMSADLRPWLPPEADPGLANLPATWAITLPRVDGEAFGDTLARVVERTVEWKSEDVGRTRAVESVLADRLVRMLGMRHLRSHWARISRALEGTGFPSLTNLGVIDEESLDFGESAAIADAYAFGPIGKPGGFVLTVSTFRHTLRLSAGFDARATDAGLARRIVEGTAAELRAAAVGEGSDRS
jgi:NRPS condensation-like uncharacterized protein